MNDLSNEISSAQRPARFRRRIPRAVAAPCMAMILLLPGGCGEFFRNQSTSLGGDQAGSRGQLRVLFINNTPQRAVFTFGAYDQSDPAFPPDFEQFGPRGGDLTLDGDTTSTIRTVDCARVFAIGSPRLHTFITENIDAAAVIAEALVEGIDFYNVGDDGNGADRVGSAGPLEALLGVDFACNALLIVYLEPTGDPTQFRIDFQVIPSASDR